MPPRESADAAAEDAALDGIPATDVARPAASDLASRYGRTPTGGAVTGAARRRRDAFAVVLVAWVAWAGLDGSRPQVQATDLGHRLLDDRAVEVRGGSRCPRATRPRASSRPQRGLHRRLEGRGDPRVRPAPPHLHRVRTAQEANTGLVQGCWLV